MSTEKHFKQVAHEGHWHAYCDGTTHIDVTDPANAHSGLAHHLKTYPCDCKGKPEAAVPKPVVTVTAPALVVAPKVD